MTAIVMANLDFICDESTTDNLINSTSSRPRSGIPIELDFETASAESGKRMRFQKDAKRMDRGRDSRIA